MKIFLIGIYLLSFLSYFLANIFSSKDAQALSAKSKRLDSLAFFFLSLGFLGNLFLIAQHVSHTHRLPLTNTPETLLSIITIIVFIFLFFHFFPRMGSAFAEKKHQLKIFGLMVSLISSLGLVAAFIFLKRPSMPLLPALQSKWLVFHVSSCIVAYCFFTISFITVIISLFRNNSGSSQKIALKQLVHRCVCIGFFLLTLGIILGSIWGKYAWGHWWNWDPKEVWALITWFIYSIYFYGRLFGNWSERKLAVIAILGFLSCLFTYLGVNFLLKGLHSYA